MSNDNVIIEKSMDFAVRIVKLYKYLCDEKKEFIMAKQLLRCGTSIGANVSEAQHGQSKADFASKMNIALKEANETIYWLTLLHKTEYMDDTQYESIKKDANDIKHILISICKTSFQK